MIVILSEGKILGKTNFVFDITEQFTTVPFDKGNPTHVKAKFLRELPALKKKEKETVPANCAWYWFISLSAFCGGFMSTETNGGKGSRSSKASKSELKRWLENGVVEVNGEKLEWNEPMDFPIFQLVLFPTNPHKRCTMV